MFRYIYSRSPMKTNRTKLSFCKWQITETKYPTSDIVHKTFNRLYYSIKHIVIIVLSFLSYKEWTFLIDKSYCEI